MGDQNFYSSFAADISDGSDISDADPQAMAKSLGGLDDMDDDILGALSKKKTTPLSKSLPVSKPAAAVAKPPRPQAKFDLDDILAKPTDDSFDDLLASKRPQTTPANPNTTKTADDDDIFSDKPRPATTSNSKPSKKFNFGDFDEEDPLAGLDLSDDDDFGMSKKKTTPKPTATKPLQVLKQASVEIDDRPKTSSGNRPVTSDQLPIKQRVGKKAGSDDGSWADSSEASDVKEPERMPFLTSEKAEEPAATPAKKSAPKKKEETTFSDDDDLDLGLDDKPPSRPTTAEKKSGFMDSLFGKSEADKHLQRPGTGGSDKNINSALHKTSPTKTALKSAASSKPSTDDDEDIFGSYAPSALGSRPGTGRSVRFEDEDTLPKRPATADPKTSTVTDDDWLGLAVNKDIKRPLGMASSTDFSGTNVDDDWLSMAAGKSVQSAAKQEKSVAPAAQKPSRTPEQKKTQPAQKKSPSDWLNELTTQLDDDDYMKPPQPVLSRRSSLDTPAAPSITQAKPKPKPAVTAGDDWLQLGDEKPLSPEPMFGGRRGSLIEQKKTVYAAGVRRPSLTADQDDDWLSKSLANKKKLSRESSRENIFNSTAPIPTESITPRQPVQQTMQPPQQQGRFLWEDPTTTSPVKQPQLFQPTPVPQPMMQSSTPHLPQTTPITANKQPVTVSQTPTFTPLLNPHIKPQNFGIFPTSDPNQMMMQQFQAQMELMRNQMVQQQNELLEQQTKTKTDEKTASAKFKTLESTDLEGTIRRLEQEKVHLESIISSLKQRHQDELSFVETSNRSRMQMVEETYQRREQRLREEIEVLTNELSSKLKLAEESRATLISSHYRKIEELESMKNMEVERLREQNRLQIEHLRQDQELAIERLKKSKDQEMDAVIATQSNPNQIQLLMEQMRQNASGLTSMQLSVKGERDRKLDEKEVGVNVRDQQLRVLQEVLLKQQEENEKERTRLQELHAKMEVQLREQERQLHQEKWTVSQEKSKLAAIQAAVEQERSLLNEQIARERAEISRAKDQLMNDQKAGILGLAEERRHLTEERSQLIINQQMFADKERSDTFRQSQGAAQYEGLIKTLEVEKVRQEEKTSKLDELEKKLIAERAILEQEKTILQTQQMKNSELAKNIQEQSEQIELLSKNCASKENTGITALSKSKRLSAINESKLQQIETQLTDLRSAEKRAAEERLNLAKEKKQIEALRNMQLCVGCKQPLSANPFFSFSTPTRRSVPSVGVVSPQKLSLADPTMIEYSIQAKQDKRYLDEETMYLDALRLSSYNH